jgi:hypothetical protein
MNPVYESMLARIWCDMTDDEHADMRLQLEVLSDIRAAWIRRQAPDWPLSFADCMRSPMHCRLIIMEWQHGAEQARIMRRALDPRSDVPDIGAPPSGVSSSVTEAVKSSVTKLDQIPPAPSGLDVKRRASGERDDA